MGPQNCKLIIGLGNPGSRYARTYHNAGQQFLSYLKGSFPFTRTERLFRAMQRNIAPEKTLILVKPSVFMNASGGSVHAALRRFHARPEEILIAHDDADLPLGTYAYAFDRGAAGHHGIESIIQTLGTKKFWRLRIGIRFNTEKAEEFVLRRIPLTHEERLQFVFGEASEKLIENEKS